MIRLVIDMNLSPDWINALQVHSIDSVHWSKIGSPSAPDTEIMAWALEHQRIVSTHDLDFGALLASSGKSSTTVIQLRAEDVRPQTMASLVASAIRSNIEILLQGALITIYPNRMRTRILPLSSSLETEP